MNVRDAYAYIGSDMERVEKALMDNLASNAALVPLVGEYITISGGKRFRPAILLLCARALGYRGRRAIDFACVTEYMHTASLLHDDVVDNAPMRRGKESANSLFGNKISILVGDFLFARASEIMVKDGDLDLLGIFSRTLVQLSEGEVLQLTSSSSPDISEEAYLEIVFNKTASLISAASETAAVIARGDGKTRRSLYEYGKNAGIAFQLMDDIIDYLGYEGETGKKRGQDLIEGKVTLPLIHTLSTCSRKDRAKIVGLLRREKTARVLDGIIDTVIGNGGIDYSRERARFFVEKAVTYLKGIPSSKAKKALVSLTRYIVERNR
ncbi:MAG: octaprenyl diphosphate synthase [Deltaproteobacteria bacterium]|nr:octaprenyl diphosphate synthase [Deltaproteobacteria bacterium]NIS77940.1 octaprenyl diphosphate synthase [Deltaproteobacteria bacterium]